MLERVLMPGRGSVTLFALGSVPFVVLVVGKMTTAALPRDVLIVFKGMTIAALNASMLSLKCKPGLAVIENKIQPATAAMTALALLAEATFVRFDFFVTAMTRTLCCAIRFVLRVTSRALHRYVSVTQGKIREAMIEGEFVQQHERRVASQVFLVACFARFRPHPRLTPVKSLPVLNVLRDVRVVMACRAQIVLCIFFELTVAAMTFVYIFFVRSGEGPRHQRFFQGVEQVRVRGKNRRQNNEQSGAQQADIFGTRETHRLIHMHGDDMRDATDQQQT